MTDQTTSTAPGAHPARLPALSAFSLPTALVVTQDGQVIARAGDVDAVHPLASVTKPLVVWSALVAVDRGLLALDDPAGPGLPGATIAHLMSHSSGVAFDSPAVLAAPGTRRVYSNFGIEILGQRLQEATATPLEAWVETTVLEPLGMASVLVPGSPAYSGSGTAADLSVFARELAAPRLVSADLAALARTPFLPQLDGVLPGYGRQVPNGFGLGLEVRGHKSPHWTGSRNSPATFGHFGQSGSFVWVDPVAGRQAVFLGEQPFGAVHKASWPALCDQILAL
ncbi:serine hydrolase domain-containing protein [Actinomyces sp. oral taxon 897]|uniref:serine hydrolase domain-containing protein n=1 Tax=Actinomyces sp. oral taxon 897 TaxID=2081702 RepID=UPI000D042C7E|nr:serine hydrolase domain-containing protein [Actinomyces sp. oral taxon 897]AVM62494.1 penicillin-binding protein [Actinomyces sp. oral taxon 897]